MADAISIQELIDARTDAKTLEEAVNGDAVTTVLSRLGETYPTLSNALNQIDGQISDANDMLVESVTTLFTNGGLPATPFKTKALMTASALVDGKYAMVTDDTVNNGLYVKTAGTWVKSGYDPLAQANTYTDNKVKGVTNNFKTKALMTASALPNGSYAMVTDDTEANNGWYSKTAGAWVKSAYDPTALAKGYVDSIPFLKPVLNPVERNLNNIDHNSIYQFSKTHATLENNFPVVSGLIIYVETLKVDGSSFAFQKVTSTSVNAEPKIHLRAGASGTWGNWTEQVVVETKNDFTPSLISTPVDINTLAGTNGYDMYSRTITTVENNFPITGESFFVETSTATGSLFTLQRAVTVTTAKPREFLRRYGGGWGNWIEQVVKGEGEVDGFDDAAWYKYVNADSQPVYQDKIPNFRRNNLLKNKDMCVVMTGTSLTASTSQHCTLRTDAHLRPPNMHANAFGSYIWDVLKWEGQQYRRYDASYFTEVGTFTTKAKDDLWDDGARDGITRLSDSTNASVGFVIPVDAWQFNFIYRTESTGCTAAVSIDEGSSYVQVYDETTSTWVEANGYSFSMLEATPVTRTVAIPDLDTEVPTNYTLSSKANTTYQKRLKMRCRSGDGSFDSRASAKNVTIANASGSGRFLYWGVEWSPRQYMMTFINSSRGSHATDARKTTGLPRYQDNEVWGFKPDLILSELAIHNDGASGASVSPVGRWERLAKQYVTDTNYELSLYSRAAHFGQTPEYAFFVGSITWNFGGINEDGTLKFSTQTASALGDARAMSALDKYHEAIQYLRSQNIVCLDTAEHWVEACKAVFGDLKTATVASGKAGATFTDEGSHWNDTGAKVMAKAVIPLVK